MGGGGGGGGILFTFVSNWPFFKIDIVIKIDIPVKIDNYVKFDFSVNFSIFVKLSTFQLLTFLSIAFDIFINIWLLFQLLIFLSTFWLKYQLVVPVKCNFADKGIIHR